MSDPAEWLEVTTLHDPERVFLNPRTGERRTESFPPPSAVVQARIAQLLAQAEREAPSEKPADPAAGG